MERNCLNCPINKISLSERKRHGNCNFDLKTEKTICCAYKCRKISAHELGKRFNCPESTIDRILEHYGIARRTLVEAQALRFERTWAFPYANYVNEFINRGWKDQLSKLIAVMLLTDGTITFPKLGRRYRKGRYRSVVAFGGGEKLNHKIFADLMKYTFDINPSSFCIEVGNGYFMTIYERQDVKPVIEQLMTLSPNYKKSPNRKETV